MKRVNERRSDLTKRYLFQYVRTSPEWHGKLSKENIETVNKNLALSNLKVFLFFYLTKGRYLLLYFSRLWKFMFSKALSLHLDEEMDGKGLIGCEIYRT